MIKAVIFDVGGVLIRTEDHSYRRLWEERLDLKPGEAEDIVFNSPMGQKAQCGEVSDEALWAWIGSRLALDDQLGVFRSDFWAGDVLDEALVEMIRSLRPAYQTAIISNATDALRESLTNQHGIADAFDLIVGSAEERTMKPAPAIFERTITALGRMPQECVFVDDFQHNVQAARDLGMAAIHYRPSTDVSAELRKLGVKVPGE